MPNRPRNNRNGGDESTNADAQAQPLDEDMMEEHVQQAVKFYEDSPRQPFDKVRCRDAPWALAFVTQLGMIIYWAVHVGFPEYKLATEEAAASKTPSEWDDETWADWERDQKEAEAALLAEEDGKSPRGASVLVILAAGVAVLASLVSFETALKNPRFIIRFGLMSLVGVCGTLACLSLLSGVIIAAILWGLLTALAVCYVMTVRHRIPFAAANLGTAGCAIKRHRGVRVRGLWTAAARAGEGGSPHTFLF